MTNIHSVHVTLIPGILLNPLRKLVKPIILAALTVRGEFWRGISVRAIFWAMKFLGQQCIVMVVLTAAVGIFSGVTMAVSVLLGGLLVVIPNTGLAICLSVKAFYIGEALKMVLIAVLLFFMLRYIDVKLAPLLIGFCGTYSVYFWSLRSKIAC